MTLCLCVACAGPLDKIIKEDEQHKLHVGSNWKAIIHLLKRNCHLLYTRDPWYTHIRTSICQTNSHNQQINEDSGKREQSQVFSQQYE